MGSDSFEDINHPGDEDSQADMTVESQQRDMNRSAYTALQQQRDPEPDSGLTITDSLERDQDQRSIEQVEPVIEENVEHAGLSSRSENEDGQRTDNSQSSDDLSRDDADKNGDGCRDTVTMLDDQHEEDDIGSGHSFQLKDKLEMVCQSAEADGSGMKMNHTPPRFLDKNFLVPHKSSEKKGEF